MTFSSPVGLDTILSSLIVYGVYGTYKGRVGGGAYITQWACNSIAIG